MKLIIVWDIQKCGGTARLPTRHALQISVLRSCEYPQDALWMRSWNAPYGEFFQTFAESPDA